MTIDAINVNLYMLVLLMVLMKYNISTNLIRVIKNLYDKATSAVLFNSSVGDCFRTTAGSDRNLYSHTPSLKYFWKRS